MGVYNYSPSVVKGLIDTDAADVINRVADNIDKAQQSICELSKRFQSPNPNEGMDRDYQNYMQALQDEYAVLKNVCTVINKIYDEATRNTQITS